MLETREPKIGLALSGASGRAVAHIGVLEVLNEHKIPIDYIVGCSSGGLVAASYAAGTLPYTKNFFFEMSFRKLMQYTSSKDAKGALFHFHNADPEFLRIMKVRDFSELPVKLGFTATDINTGELITLTEGDIIKAFKATIAVPGLFEPVVWGDHILVDGGLVNVVPTKPVREMGADIVIGINLAATKFIYEKKMPIWRGYRFVTRLLGLQFIRERVLPFFSSRLFFSFDSQSDIIIEEDIKIPGMWSMMAKAIDHSFEIEKTWTESEIACDLMLEPRVKHYGKTEFESMQKIYEEGRRAAEAAIPKIRELIRKKKRQQFIKEVETKIMDFNA